MSQKSENKTNEVATVPTASNLFPSIPTFAGMDLSFNENEFEEASVDFFETTGMEGIRMNVVFQETVEIEVKEEKKSFVKGYVLLENGWKLLYFGQAQIIRAFERYDKGKGVKGIVTFKGKVPVKGTAKTMNDFEILLKSL